MIVDIDGYAIIITPPRESGTNDFIAEADFLFGSCLGDCVQRFGASVVGDGKYMFWFSSPVGDAEDGECISCFTLEEINKYSMILIRAIEKFKHTGATE